MKRVAIPIVFLLAVLLAVPAMANDLPDPDKVPFDQAVKELNTPQKVNAWIRKYTSYDVPRAKEIVKYARKIRKERNLGKGDDVDLIWEIIYTPSETYAKRGGVCFDIANFATYCLRRAGYDAMTVSIHFWRIPKVGADCHAISVCHTEDGWYIVADATRFKMHNIDGPFSKLKSIFTKWHRRHGVKYIFNSYTKMEGQTAREPYHQWSLKEFCKIYDQ